MIIVQDLLRDVPYTELNHSAFWVEFIVRHQVFYSIDNKHFTEQRKIFISQIMFRKFHTPDLELTVKLDKHLNFKCQNLDLNFLQYFLVDVIAFVLAVAIATLYVVRPMFLPLLLMNHMLIYKVQIYIGLKLMFRAMVYLIQLPFKRYAYSDQLSKTKKKTNQQFLLAFESLYKFQCRT